MQSLLMLDLDSDIHDKLIVSPIIKPPYCCLLSTSNH